MTLKLASGVKMIPLFIVRNSKLFVSIFFAVTGKQIAFVKLKGNVYCQLVIVMANLKYKPDFRSAINVS